MTTNLPPSSIQSEEALLGSILIDPEEMFRIVSILKSEDFYREQNRWIYEAMMALQSRSEGIDQIAVGRELERQGKLKDIGGAAYLSHLIAYLPTSVNAESFARIVAECSFQRKLIAFGGGVASLGYMGKDKPGDMLATIQKQLLALSPPTRRTLIRPLDRMQIAGEMFAKRLDGNLKLLPFGFSDLDKLLSGMAPGELIVVGARTYVGKSTFLRCVAHHLASQGKRVLFCSDETAIQQFIDEEVASKTKLPIQVLIKGQYSTEDYRKICDAIESMSRPCLNFLGGMAITTTDIEARAMELQMEHGLDLIVVDYLQLLSDKWGNSLYERITYIAQALKHIAVSLDLPLLTASQLNRAVEERRDKHPLMHDIRESGNIEQDADTILLLYRDDIHYTREQWGRDPERNHLPYPSGIIEVGLAKHRATGQTGMIKLVWRADRRIYGDLAKEAK